jgi:hypothetical protein
MAPSDRTIGDALQAIAEAAIPGLFVSREAIGLKDIPGDQYPHLILLQTDYGAQRIAWNQIERLWTFSGTLVEKIADRTRDDIADDLDAIRDGVYADQGTLSGLVDATLWSSSVPETHSDDVWGFGLFDVSAEWTA